MDMQVRIACVWAANARMNRMRICVSVRFRWIIPINDTNMQKTAAVGKRTAITSVCLHFI